MMKVSILAAVCVAAAFASPLKQQTGNGDWCIVTDFPRACSENSTLCSEWARFPSEADCLAGGVVANTDGYCHTAWWPATCDHLSAGHCISTEYPPGGFATEADCLGTANVTATPTATATPTVTPVPSGYCHTAWWPAACDLISNGDCIGSEYPTGGYATEADCLGGASVATGSGYCHTSWWPIECDLISNGNCIGFEYPPGGYSTMANCTGEGNVPTVTPVPSGSGYCHTSWWPEVCELISGGNCIGSEYPVGGYASEDACLSTGAVTQTPAPTPTVNPTDYCVTQWWPKTCGLVVSSTCLTTDVYANQTDCTGIQGPTTTNGYCVTSWWPLTCALVSSGTCVGWYPPPAGWVTEADCLGDDNKAIAKALKDASSV